MLRVPTSLVSQSATLQNLVSGNVLVTHGICAEYFDNGVIYTLKQLLFTKSIFPYINLNQTTVSNRKIFVIPNNTINLFIYINI